MRRLYDIGTLDIMKSVVAYSNLVIDLMESAKESRGTWPISVTKLLVILIDARMPLDTSGRNRLERPEQTLTEH